MRDGNEPRIPEPTNTPTTNQRLNTTSQRLEEFLLEMEQRGFVTVRHPHIVFGTSGLENREFEEESWVREDNFIVKEDSYSFYYIFDIEHKFFKISAKTLQEELESVYTSFNLNVDYLGQLSNNSRFKESENDEYIFKFSVDWNKTDEINKIKLFLKNYE